MISNSGNRYSDKIILNQMVKDKGANPCDF